MTNSGIICLNDALAEGDLPCSISGRHLSPDDPGPVDSGRLVRDFWSILLKQCIITKKKTIKMTLQLSHLYQLT
jgi:hypothetical protein